MKKLKKIHAMLYAMEHDPAIGRTKLMKFIFFVDLIHYNQRGSLLFDSAYIRMPNGPVDPVAYSLTGETNDFFTVKKSRGNKNNPATGPYDHYLFQVRVPVNTDMFSHYELALFHMVLTALKAKKATLVSSLTHQLRLWKEFRDGEEIPLDYFALTDDEIRLIESFGFFIDGFQREFCSRITTLSRDLADALHPLARERVVRVERILDDLIVHYPLPSLDIFYDAYLAWDDTFRSALRLNPAVVSSLTAECCDALCFTSYAVQSGAVGEDDLAAYCGEVEERFDTIRESLFREHPANPCEVEMMEGDLLDRTMHLSRSLALETPSGRR
ncbi:type II toxin-antitoxin system antitoxin SocA domain-containing protein [uncultured Methanofollis sp.]|uniref:type II toxin-antitoxin system antitoxin SocA domain-containing protein n=1 Tax=uncultured Methanofollis sp. TaxID=262500 RepID=UPI00262A1D90|nr:type II toxin-antitoxin system antitoxin SocA domain-containing protein [uncultured Methanofollis sp.]